MTGRQLDFPNPQKQARWLAPALLGVAVGCVVAVVLLLAWDTQGPFIGPWG